MARLVKCPICDKMNEKENTVHHKNRYYCPDCLKKKQEEAEKHRKEPNDWDKLFRYLCELYGHKPTGRMFKQLGDFKKPPYNYTNMGMLLTLKYFHETLDNPVKQDTGIGIIPYVYDEAKKNFLRLQKINETNINAEYNDSKLYIKVKPETITKKRHKIDFETLEDDR